MNTRKTIKKTQKELKSFLKFLKKNKTSKNIYMINENVQIINESFIEQVFQFFNTDNTVNYYMLCPYIANVYKDQNTNSIIVSYYDFVIFYYFHENSCRITISYAGFPIKINLDNKVFYCSFLAVILLIAIYNSWVYCSDLILKDTEKYTIHDYSYSSLIHEIIHRH